MLVRLPKNPDDKVTLCPTFDFRRPEAFEDLMLAIAEKHIPEIFDEKEI